jgi:hypothetical protein
MSVCVRGMKMIIKQVARPAKPTYDITMIGTRYID